MDRWMDWQMIHPLLNKWSVNYVTTGYGTVYNITCFANVVFPLPGNPRNIINFFSCSSFLWPDWSMLPLLETISSRFIFLVSWLSGDELTVIRSWWYDDRGCRGELPWWNVGHWFKDNCRFGQRSECVSKPREWLTGRWLCDELVWNRDWVTGCWPCDELVWNRDWVTGCWSCDELVWNRDWVTGCLSCDEVVRNRDWLTGCWSCDELVLELGLLISACDKSHGDGIELTGGKPSLVSSRGSDGVISFSGFSFKDMSLSTASSTIEMRRKWSIKFVVKTGLVSCSHTLYRFGLYKYHMYFNYATTNIVSIAMASRCSLDSKNYRMRGNIGKELILDWRSATKSPIKKPANIN